MHNSDDKRSMSFQNAKYTTEYSNETVRNLKHDFKAKVLIINPKYQRNYLKAFDDEFKTRLIETTLNRLIIPSVFFVKKFLDNSVKTEIVDGQQRVRTLVSFVNDEFRLKRMYLSDAFKHLGGKLFSELDVISKDSIENYKLNIQWLNLNFIDAEMQDDIIKEVFIRINSSSLSLSNIELINAKFGFNKFYSILRDIAYMDFWLDFISLDPDDNTRKKEISAMNNVEKLIRLLMFSEHREVTSGIWIEIDKYLRAEEENNREIDTETLKNDIIRKLTYIIKIIDHVLLDNKLKTMRIPNLAQRFEDANYSPDLFVGKLSIGMIDLHGGIYGWLAKKYTYDQIMENKVILNSLYYDTYYILSDSSIKLGGTPKEVIKKINLHNKIIHNYFNNQYNIDKNYPVNLLRFKHIKPALCSICKKVIHLNEDLVLEYSRLEDTSQAGVCHRLCNLTSNRRIIYDNILDEYNKLEV